MKTISDRTKEKLLKKVDRLYPDRKDIIEEMDEGTKLLLAYLHMIQKNCIFIKDSNFGNNYRNWLKKKGITHVEGIPVDLIED